MWNQASEGFEGLRDHFLVQIEYSRNLKEQDKIKLMIFSKSTVMIFTAEQGSVDSKDFKFSLKFS